MPSTPLTAAADRIVQLALPHFAERGYDTTSLNDIAVSAGIRKASLYAHFTGKNELYGAVLELALSNEWDYMNARFAAATREGIPGEHYVDSLQHRFNDSSALRFLLRAAFYPPTPLEHAVKSGFEHYLAGIGERFRLALQRAYPDIDTQHSALLGEAYLALIDSLHVELIYGNEQAYSRRLGAVRTLVGLIGRQRLAQGAVSGHERQAL